MCRKGKTKFFFVFCFACWGSPEVCYTSRVPLLCVLIFRMCFSVYIYIDLLFINFYMILYYFIYVYYILYMYIFFKSMTKRLGVFYFSLYIILIMPILCLVCAYVLRMSFCKMFRIIWLRAIFRWTNTAVPHLAWVNIKY